MRAAEPIKLGARGDATMLNMKRRHSICCVLLSAAHLRRAGHLPKHKSTGAGTICQLTLVNVIQTLAIDHICPCAL